MKLVSSLFFAAVAFVMSGCVTNHLLPSKQANLPGTAKENAKTIYDLAKKCWHREEGYARAQIIVENFVTVDSIVVSARFDSFGSRVMNPFTKFILSDSGAGTHVELQTQEIKWMGYEEHLRDADNWMAGDFRCSSAQ